MSNVIAKNVHHKAPTIRQVASQAGVGIATVSRVLNKSSLVVPETTEHVLAVMRQLGYSPDLPEKRRGKGKREEGSKHQAICILSTGTHSLQWMIDYAPIYAYAVHGAQAALTDGRVNCVIRHLPQPPSARELKNLRVDGLLMMAHGDWQQWPAEIKTFPSVRMFGLPGGGWGDCVTYNNDTVGKLAAEYLYQAGARNPVVVGPSEGEVFPQRSEAFTRWVERFGGRTVNLTRADIIQAGPETNATAKEVIDRLIDLLFSGSESKPDGIFVMSDLITPAVYRAIERHGIMPGRDIPIVSCNNEKPYLHPLHPKPAVVDLQAEMIGQQAVERLLWRIENPRAPRVTLLLEPLLISPEN